ncbi:unnamed protein product, partial [Ixodes pacificus]
MLLLWVLELLALQELQILTELLACRMRLNYVRYGRRTSAVAPTSDGSRERVAELPDVLVLVLGHVLLAPEQDRDCPLGSHDRHLGRGPRVVDVTPQVLGAHHVVRAAVRLPYLACDDGDLGHCGLSVSIQELGPMPDDSLIFLRGPWNQITGSWLDLEKDLRAVWCGFKADNVGSLHKTKEGALTGCRLGVVGHHSHGLAVHPGEAHNQVFGIHGHDLKEVPVIHHLSAMACHRLS